MENHGLFSTLFIQQIKNQIELDDSGRGRMASADQTWHGRDASSRQSLWQSFLKPVLGYLEFVSPDADTAPGIYPLFEDWGFSNCITALCLIPPGADLDEVAIGRFWPGLLIAELKRRRLTWGILTDGARWRLYSTRSVRPFEDYVELPLAEALQGNNEAEYTLFERFFHRDSFLPESQAEGGAEEGTQSQGIVKCRLDRDVERSEEVLEKTVKNPLLYQVDEVLQYLCNGFIQDTPKTGAEYTEEERAEIFQSAVKLLYRCLFLFYAEARRLLPTDEAKRAAYEHLSIQSLCREARRFRWGQRKDFGGYDLWQHLKGLVAAVNDGDPEYGILGYNGGLFDDEEEKYLGRHRLRNDFLWRALYLLAYVEPAENNPQTEYAVPYEDLEVRHLGELYENLLEYTVILADADRIRRRLKIGVKILLASETTQQQGDSLIRKGDVFFGESALERKQTGSYYTPESIVHFINEKSIINPLLVKFENNYRPKMESFQRQICESSDITIRQGAARSAVALVERFVQEDVLAFKVCDPAMGSGHFLVDVSNQMTSLIVELLAEIPDTTNNKYVTSCRPNYWRRLVTRHCLYGVDLNPLAVDLAKLALWLSCFASDHKLTFLDHHLRCGNSLIGLGSLKQLSSLPERKKELSKKKNKQRLLFDYKKLSNTIIEAAQGVSLITQVDEDDTSGQKEIFDRFKHAMADILPLADMFITFMIDQGIKTSEYQIFIEHITKEKPIENSTDPTMRQICETIKQFRALHHYFHWPLEFPEVFGPGTAEGFSAIVGNPPWDMVSAQPAEFFEKYDSVFRSLKRSESLARIKSLCNFHPEIAKGWEKHQKRFKDINQLFNEPTVYEHAPTGRNNLFHYFLHRAYDLVHIQGFIGMVLPGSFNADKGAFPLRKLYFEKCNILTFFCFSNEKFIFKKVHHAFRFIIFTSQKGIKTNKFKACFFTDPREAIPLSSLESVLHHLDKNGHEISFQTVELFSPGKLSVLEFRGKRDAQISDHLYSVADRLGASSNELQFKFSIEMMSNTDAWRFENADQSDIPVYVGRCFQQFDHQLASVTSFIREDMLDSVYSNSNHKPWKNYRIVFRDVTGGTSERTCISCILPPPNACLETARILYPSSEALITEQQLQAYTVAILNSFCTDYILRFMVRLHLSQHIMERVPFKRCSDASIFFHALVARTARLVATSEAFSDFWKACYNPLWQSSKFWYDDSVSIDSYGPIDEQKIRLRILDEANTLTVDWGPHCAVRDRLPDRRERGNRAQLRAEIDAYIAHLYRLNREDFAYILDTFPVLKKKEEKLFGEFISKRKALEEYDRLAKIL